MILLASFYTLAGAVCLLWPRRVQAMVLSQSPSVGGKYGRVLRFVRSHRYIWALRIVGILSAIAAIVLLQTVSRTSVTNNVPQRYIQVDTIHSI